ncbi:hypothetical protein BBP00_00005277 [Phytophthora kernoviae]|uniref:Tryptophan synthase beta chain-like PALP domain-containing protein n=1 Tax=Phytophthora kernoviae TaxID=325452 RepID=A0A3F2RPG0_9STRA|nr:hypothetical protein BBP00_00005277 [Phytophthora kernoviae]
MATIPLQQDVGQNASVSTPGSVDLLGSVGNTPLLELPTLSRLTGCKLLAKAEFMNPSGSIKDRVAKSLILDAEERGLLKPGGTIIEATGGSTGVSLALLGASRGYKTLLTMPDITANEKVQMMKTMGAQVHILPHTSISDKDNHFFHVAQRLAKETPNAYCPNQFDNLANMKTHYEGTAPEIWEQVGGQIDGFVSSAGTSGTIAGMSRFLKEQNPDLKVWVIDPEEAKGISMFINNDRSTGTMQDGFEMVPMTQGSTIAEGVAALARVTENCRQAIIDGGITGTNQEIVDMAYFLLRNDGVFVGPSSALNVLGAVKMARELGPGHTIVTILADGGVRYGSKLYNEEWLREHDMLPQEAAAKHGATSLDFVGELKFPTCKLAYEVQHTMSETLILEMHRKRCVIQSALHATKLDEEESKRLIHRILALEQDLKLVGRERRLKKADHVFLTSEQSSMQSNWSIDTTKVPLFSANTTILQTTEKTAESLSYQLRLDLQSQRDLDAYFDMVIDIVVQALVDLLLIAPEKPAVWFVLHLRKGPSSSKTTPVDSPSDASRRSSSVDLHAASPELFTINVELSRKLEEIKDEQLQMRSRLEAMQKNVAALEQEVAVRNRFIAKLSETHVTTRTQAIMDGTPVFLNSQKHWVLPGFLLVPKTLSVAELQGLRCAESFLMEKDELHWKFLLRAQLDLPRWCRIGREVIVAPSIAQKCAISFQFYPKKDFPAGNYRREPKETSVAELMEIARQEESCAGFTTDGALKRFLPRMLSQLKPMMCKAEDGDDNAQNKLAEEDGLYVKLFPKKDDTVINSAIVVEVPEDRFGLVRVVLDGIAITELVPVTKLTDRWKRIRVKRLQVVERRKTRAIVFGRVASSTLLSAVEIDQSIVQPGTTDTSYERIESDEEDEEESLEKEWRRQRRLLRRRQREQKQPNGGVDLNDAPDYIFEDLATGCIMRRGHPKNTHDNSEVRLKVIATRKKEYEDEQHRRSETKKLVSAVKIQCAYRSKRARQHFRQMLALRAKERERERLVNEVGAANAHRRKSRHIKLKKSGGSSFFSRFRRR